MKKDTDVVNPNTGHHFEIDLWVPNEGLCFEFQVRYNKSDLNHRALKQRTRRKKRGSLLILNHLG